MRKAVFEVATLADAIAKATRIAPTKGAAFDRAAGVVIATEPDAWGNQAVVSATDLDTSFRTTITALSVSGESAHWRLPSALLNGLMRTLPMSGEIELVETDAGVQLSSGRTRSVLRPITTPYPVIPVFDRDGMKAASNLAQRLSQVSWAVDSRSSEILSGVHIDGTHLYGCDRASLAIVPCEVPLENPVTAPLSEIASVLRNVPEVHVRATDQRLQLMPDEHTQATCRLLEGAYPNVRALLDRVESTHEITISVEGLVGMIDRTMVLTKEERLPHTNIEIGDGYLQMSMRTDVGEVEDRLEGAGGGSEPFSFAFSPENLRKAVSASGRPEVKLSYQPLPGRPVLITDDNEFTALMMPRMVA